MCSGDGVLTSTKDVVDRWREFFKDLLNPTNAPSGEEAEPGDPAMGSLISGAEKNYRHKKIIWWQEPGGGRDPPIIP